VPRAGNPDTWAEQDGAKPHDRFSLITSEPVSGRKPFNSPALYQGTTLELAEKLASLKGTAFRPYITAV
jgi:hypothetical protein